MEKLNFLQFSLGIMGMLLVSLITFFILKFDTNSKIRWLTWTLFYLSMASLSYAWFRIFFPEFMTSKDIFLENSIFAWLALLSIIGSAFCVWFVLRSKGNKRGKTTAKWILILSLICLLVFTTLGVNIKLEDSINNMELVE